MQSNDQTPYTTKTNFWWILKMALRDSRKNKSRLLLFISSIVLGIASMVAISSFSDNLKTDIDLQAAELIGADLVVDSRKELSQEAQHLVDSLKSASSAFAEEKSFASMALFEKNGGNRLVDIRALGGNFPFYGKLETVPESAESSFRSGRNALVDKTLMLQFNAEVGDQVVIGNQKFTIAGALTNAPGQSGISSSVAPAIFIPLEYLESTGLLQKGSRVSYNFYYQFPKTTDVDNILEKLDAPFELEGLDGETIQMRKESTGRSFEDLTGFLSLVGFVALLLGCIGVSSAIQIYIREKLNSIAILRCLGVSSRQAFLIFLIQVAGIGLIGSVLGAALGVLIQQLLPVVLQDLLPVAVSNDLSILAIAKGIALGVFISILFALLPLIGIHTISPLNTLRLSYEENDGRKNRYRTLVYGLIILFVLLFARMQLDGWFQTLAFTAGVLLGFLILYGVSLLLVKLVKKYFPHSWSYLWRQGLSNLYRPNNQTVIMVMAIGLGTAFIATLFFVKALLISQLSFSAGSNQPNMVLFDIQSSQKQKVLNLVNKENLPVIQEVPIVTVQLESINGYNEAAVRKDSTIGLSPRSFGRELRVTYRDSIISSEKITDGLWIGEVGKGDTARVSLEKEYAERAGLKIGDHLVYNVQGLMVPAIVGSFREVDWNRVQTNFRLVFPKGVIDDAPQFHVIMTRTPNSEASAAFQLAVVQQFPTVSIIDLNLILTILDEILNKIGFVIQFMAALSILTGIIVLIASVMISKYQRVRESVLLRTMGASRKQILTIAAMEYLFLGTLAASAGIVIALLSSWALAVFSFELPFVPNILLILSLFVGVSALTVVIGIFNSTALLNRTPLEVLRKEN